ncbi:hypothetical protein HDV06_004591 [Boothiomyces sp. JEL0866]|nr:hypothetical protein HDV06_004591 [Boothiomyces sp. JEL0866]
MSDNDQLLKEIDSLKKQVEELRQSAHAPQNEETAKLQETIALQNNEIQALKEQLVTEKRKTGSNVQSIDFNVATAEQSLQNCNLYFSRAIKGFFAYIERTEELKFLFAEYEKIMHGTIKQVDPAHDENAPIEQFRLVRFMECYFANLIWKRCRERFGFLLAIIGRNSQNIQNKVGFYHFFKENLKNSPDFKIIVAIVSDVMTLGPLQDQFKKNVTEIVTDAVREILVCQYSVNLLGPNYMLQFSATQAQVNEDIHNIAGKIAGASNSIVVAAHPGFFQQLVPGDNPHDYAQKIINGSVCWRPEVVFALESQN